MPGDPVTAIAELVREVFTWVTDPTKYAQLSREMKLEKLTAAQKVCLDNRDLIGADLIYAELRRVSATTG